MVIKHGALLSGIFGLSGRPGLSVPVLIVGLSIIEAALYRPRCKRRYTGKQRAISFITATTTTTTTTTTTAAAISISGDSLAE